jgi:hypothetical protein
LKALITSILCTIENRKLNGVIETEVKRHRRMDFISSIENQLGFIPNIELLIADGNMEYVSPNKRNIAVNVLFSNDKLLVESWNYTTSNSIEARDDSNIMISYGTINFEELEMKSTQEMCLHSNINEVDVTLFQRKCDLEYQN